MVDECEEMLLVALSVVQAFVATPSCVLRVRAPAWCQRPALASAARDAESRRKMAIFDACAHTLCRTRLTTRCCHRLLTECALHQRRCGKGRAITREETEELRSVGGRRADRYGEITPKGFEALGRRLRLGPRDTFADCGSGVGMALTQAIVVF